MICKNCGAELKENSAFCHICGAKLEPGEMPTQAVTPVPSGSRIPTDDRPRKANKAVVIAEVLGTILLAVFVCIYIFRPIQDFESDPVRSGLGRLADSAQKYLTEMPKATKAPTGKPTGEPTKAPTEAPANVPTATPTPTQVPKYTGKGFYMEDGILKVDGQLFGKTWDELNQRLPGGLPELEYWEWSAVPLDWCGFEYNGCSGSLFFEHNRLVGVRFEEQIPKNAIPESLQDRADQAFGNASYYWFNNDSGLNYEIDWYYIPGFNGEYDIFLNPYGGNYYVCQQYTSDAFSGVSIQSR